MFLAGLVMASRLLHIISLDAAALYPELAQPRLPLCVAVRVVLVPMIVAVKGRARPPLGRRPGEAFSP